MIRVHVICEGQTEEMFVNELLKPAFAGKGVYLRPALIGKPGHKGGNVMPERLYRDIRNRLASDRSSYCTTFIDFYGLPSDFPGKSEIVGSMAPEDKAALIEARLSGSVAELLGADVTNRFIPYIQMHEFEALLFSAPDVFALSIDQNSLRSHFESIRAAFTTPEMINDSPQTAPSKRILDVLPGYEKPLMGCIASLDVGLVRMRRACPLFNAWLGRLESLFI